MNDDYNIGDVALLSCEFKNPRRGTRVDPTDVFCKIRKPGQDPLDIPVSRTAPGIYEAEIDLDVSGTWHYRFAGTGAYQAADEDEFKVQADAF